MTDYREIKKLLQYGDSIILSSISQLGETPEECVGNYISLTDFGIRIVDMANDIDNMEFYDLLYRGEHPLDLKGDKLDDTVIKLNWLKKANNRFIDWCIGRYIRRLLKKPPREEELL